MAKEYIDREALREDLKKAYNRLRMIYDSIPPYGEDKLLCGRELCAFLEAVSIVKAAPAADVVEVVRCKDCRFRSPKYDEPERDAHIATTKFIRNEAIKEFAERLKKHSRKMQSSDFSGDFWDAAVLVEEIDNIVKEMVGERSEK